MRTKFIILLLFFASHGLLYSQNSLNLSWETIGPQNIGGTTRAFLVDTVRGYLYAGSLGGGLWYSIDGGNNWMKIDDQTSNLQVSCIAQASNGDIYFGTGGPFPVLAGQPNSSGFQPGGGIFRSTDGINFFHLNSTIAPINLLNSTFARITDLKIHPTTNRIYAGTQGGLLVSSDGGNTWDNDFINGLNGAALRVHDIEISSNGGILIGIGPRIYYSASGEKHSFSNVSTPAGSVSRIEIANAPSSPSVWYATISNSYSATGFNYNTLAGVYLTENNGQTWIQIGHRTPGTFTPFTNNSGDGMGNFASSSAVDPNDPWTFFLGGFQLYKWKRTSPSSLSGTWENLASPNSSFLGKNISPFIYRLVIDPENPDRLYAGTEKGIYRSTDGGETIYPANQGYDVGMFYSVGFSGTGEVIGGSQYQGTQYINPSQSLDKNNVKGTWGGYSDISNIKPNVLFASENFSTHFRSVDFGNTFLPFYHNGHSLLNSADGPLRLWESFNDPLSVDSVWYVNNTGEWLPAGSPIIVNSNTEGVLINDTLTSFLGEGDSTRVRDPIRSRLAVVYYNSLWVCLNPLNVMESAIWVKLGNITGIESMNFSRDGNSLFVAKYSDVYRISNISALSRNDSSTSFSSPPNSKITIRKIGSFSKPVNAVYPDPDNPDNVLLSLGGYGLPEYLLYSSNAYAASTEAVLWESRQGNLPLMPVYSVLIDKTDSRRAIVGTDLGVFGTTDITSSVPEWHQEKNWTLPNSPVYMLRQQLLDNNWDNGITNSGCIYAATHGRGIWKTCTLGSPDVGRTEKNLPDNTLKLFPNPANQELNAEVYRQKPDVSTVRIYDLRGAEVFKETRTLNGGKNIISLKTSALSPGIYLLQIISPAGSLSERFSVVH